MKSWSNIRQNINLNKFKRFSKNITVISVIDANGLAHKKKLNGFINGEIYRQFLRELEFKVGSQNIAIFFDGLSVHKMKASWELILKEFSWIGILNVAYSPDFNPIELYFSMIKREFRKNLL
jgi:transposase